MGQQSNVTTAVEVRAIDAGDPLFGAAKELRYEVLRKPLGRPLEKGAHEDQSLHYVALQAEQVVGYVRLWIEGDHGQIYSMAVDPDRRLRGIGRSLLEHVEQQAHARGVHTLALDARMSAQGFYARLGYQDVGQPFEKVGLPHIRMTKTLRERARGPSGR